MMRKVFKFLGGGFAMLLIIGFLVYSFIDESLPNGTHGQEAERLTDEMLAALNKPAFDTLRVIRFTYPGGRSYEWNRADNSVNVAWDDNDVFLDLERPVDEYNSLEYQAYEYFINDSFWLAAPFKVRDAGVIRSTLKVEDGRGLLVTYTMGGVTPGDSYLWIIDERGFPKAWKLWTSNVPIGGLRFGRESWVEKEGVWFSLFHPSEVTDLEITDLEVE